MIKTKGLTGAEALLRVLNQMGIDHIFSSPGSEWSPLWESLAEPLQPGESQPFYLSSRHEELTVAMASGYAKASGKLPAVLLHGTVGSLHATMALRGALHEQVPMVVFAGESIAFGEDEGPDPGEQWLRQLADVGGVVPSVERCVKWSTTVNSKAVLPAMVQRACQLAMQPPRGPVFVCIPAEFLFDKMTTDAPASRSFPVPATASLEAIEELADTLTKAKNPIIISESAGENPRAVERLVELAELLGVPVVETRFCAYGNFPRSHPLHGGFEPAEFLQDADVVFLVSAVAPWHPASMRPKEGSKVIVLDENPLRAQLPFWGFPVDVCLTGEVESSLKHLLERLRERLGTDDGTRSDRSRHWRDRYEKRRQKWREEVLALENDKVIDNRWVAHELNQVLPADAIVVDETITHRLALYRYLDRLEPGSFFSGFVGGLGTGLGTALGVKTAISKRPVVALIGDGTFNFNPALAALGFAQEYGMPILIVLFNNHGYLSMKTRLSRYYPEGWAMRTGTVLGTSISPSPDYGAIARAFGGYGEKVEKPGEVRTALERGFKAVAGGQVALIDLWMEPC